MIRIAPLHEIHYPELWRILRNYPEYFDDNLKCETRTLKGFALYMRGKPGLVGINGNEVIGCSYLSEIYNDFGEINIFVKRRSVRNDELLAIVKDNIKYFFNEFNLKMIYALTRIDNKSCMRMMKYVGMKPMNVMKDYEIVDGKKKDCLMSVILREEVLK